MEHMGKIAFKFAHPIVNWTHVIQNLANVWDPFVRQDIKEIFAKMVRIYLQLYPFTGVKHGIKTCYYNNISQMHIVPVFFCFNPHIMFYN